MKNMSKIKVSLIAMFLAAGLLLCMVAKSHCTLLSCIRRVLPTMAQSAKGTGC